MKSNLRVSEEINNVKKLSLNKIYSAEMSEDKILYRFIKRVLDIVFSLLVIIGLSPVYILMALKIKSDDRLKKELDLYYLENRSLLLDIKILFKTVFTVVKRQGAY